MKQNVSPALMAGLIIAVVAIVAFIGYKVFASSEAGDNAEMRHKYAPNGGGAGPAAHAPAGSDPSLKYRSGFGGGSRPPGQ